MLYSLIYTSQATVPLDKEARRLLLTQARAYNTARHLTGVLLHADGHFLQILEGAQEEVEALFDRIQQDPRHEGIRVVVRGPVRRREFPHWGMGFSQLSYPILARLRQLVRHSQAAVDSTRAALSLRDLLQPFVLHAVAWE
ncbi:BLUF domain-containing protein [Hymenobacter sp. BT491]|uniref:BLUF domain-containing protein n=1 Tax=Hymenobacter sp. BT491 TaxID=2766779 RepID=UPI001653E3FC|nr:BLUF domain-containing protein [Hymenobacter sp. BT491]MBC6988533.1 BLUF domain-containing protein [Hymenobacter sp. BT491]